MAKKRPKKSGCLTPFTRLTLIVLLLVLIGFVVFYSIDNPGFLSGLRERFSSDPKDEAEVLILDQEEAASEPEEEEPEEGKNLMESLKEKLLDENREEEEQQLDTRLNIRLYYASLGQDMMLEAEERVIVAGNRKTALLNAARELLKGPSKPYLFPVVPGGTSLIAAEVNENLASIDLSREFLDNSLDSRILDELVIYSIVNTVTEIEGLDGVIFYIEGKRIKVYGNIDLSLPAIRRDELIYKEE